MGCCSIALLTLQIAPFDKESVFGERRTGGSVPMVRPNLVRPLTKHIFDQKLQILNANNVAGRIVCFGHNLSFAVVGAREIPKVADGRCDWLPSRSCQPHCCHLRLRLRLRHKQSTCSQSLDRFVATPPSSALTFTSCALASPEDLATTYSFLHVRIENTPK